jgi:hypothetical protein
LYDPNIHRHPELVSHAFSVCSLYTAPHKEYHSTEDIVNGRAPQFGYQLQLASPEVESAVQTKEQLRQFLNGMYGGKGPNGEVIFSPEKGVLFENLPKVGKSKLFSDKVCTITDTSSSTVAHHVAVAFFPSRAWRHPCFACSGRTHWPVRMGGH